MADYFIGLMSGTSVDGVDGVLAEIDHQTFRVIDHLTHPFEPAIRAEAESLVHDDRDSLNRAWRLANKLSDCYSEVVNRLCRQNAEYSIRAIGCHGQTLRHFPDTSNPITIQVVNGAALAIKTGITTVTDFRSADLALGGQGAPLAPAFHQQLFRSDKADRIVLNLGGIANITLLPAKQSRPVLGFDTGPANALLDDWVSEHRGQPFDDRGTWAASGMVQNDLLEQMLTDRYFSLPAPKSTGRESFNRQWLNTHLAGKPDLSPVDVQATLVELSARSIADGIQSVCLHTPPIYACGGGTYNEYLLKRIAACAGVETIHSTAELGLPPMMVEAGTFAWLAYRRISCLSGNLPAVTGASREAILGAVYQP